MRKLVVLFFALLFATLAFARGGGGCFLPGTVVDTLEGGKLIESVSLGDSVLSFLDGNITNSAILSIYEVKRDFYYDIETSNGGVNATAEHPFYVGNGTFKEALFLAEGEIVYIFSNGSLKAIKIESITRINKSIRAYNLEVGEPHTFFANGFAVHNKGGGRGGGRSSGPPSNVFTYNCANTANFSGQVKQCCIQVSSSYSTSWSTKTFSDYPHCANGISSRGCTNDAKFTYPIASSNMCPVFSLADAVCPACGGILFIALFFLVFGKKSGLHSNGEWSSTVGVPKDMLEAKAKKTSALLSLWGKANPVWDEKTMRETATKTFYKLQECWQKREYVEMRPFMMPSLYSQHVSQLEAMKTRHEINNLEDLKLLDLQIILVSNYYKQDRDEFTIWIKAQAKDIIIDDRTSSKIRGDNGVGVFEEFWAFQRQGTEWKLRKIDQPEESMGVVSMENYDEISPQSTLERTYEKAGSAAKKRINVESVREQEDAGSGNIGTIKWKSGRVGKLLNFLSSKDTIWLEEGMRDTARTFFISVNTATEQRNISMLAGKVVPELYQRLETSVAELIAKNQRIEKRNLTARNIEIVLVKNYYDNSKDEFTAWISGQAEQAIVEDKSGRQISGDGYVKDFEEYWTFVRNENKWILKSIDPGFKGDEYISRENFDEGSTKFLMDWYYTRDRAI